MAAQRDITGYFLALKEVADNNLPQHMPAVEQEKLKLLLALGLAIGESIVTDLNRMADALEELTKR